MKRLFHKHPSGLTCIVRMPVVKSATLTKEVKALKDARLPKQPDLSKSWAFAPNIATPELTLPGVSAAIPKRIDLKFIPVFVSGFAGMITSRFREAVSAKIVSYSAAALLVTGTVAGGYLYGNYKHVEIFAEGSSPVAVSTFANTVGDALKLGGIALNPGDKVNADLSSQISDGMSITVYRAMPVEVTVGGETKDLLTTKHTVGGILADLGYSYSNADIITPGVDETLPSGGGITLVKTSEDTVTVRASIPYSAEIKNDNTLDKGQKKIVQAGQDGAKELVYKVTYNDGAEVNRELIATNIVQDSVDQITAVGTKVTPAASSGAVAVADTAPAVTVSRGDDFKYAKAITVTATAYSGGGRTASGRAAQYGVIAVDPSVIPLGTRLYIESTDGSWVYGTAVAGDTGGAIKGNRIDLYFNSESECRNFGRRSATVYVLE